MIILNIINCKICLTGYMGAIFEGKFDFIQVYNNSFYSIRINLFFWQILTILKNVSNMHYNIYVSNSHFNKNHLHIFDYSCLKVINFITL